MGKHQNSQKASPKGKVHGKDDKKSFKKKFQSKDNGNKSTSLKNKKPSSIKGMKALLKAKDGSEVKADTGKKRKFDHSSGSDGKSFKKPKHHSDNSNKKDKKEQKPAPGKNRKPYFQLVEKLKQLWNKIRERTVQPAQRDALLANLLQGIQSHIVEITLRHDASRIIQTLIQFGNDQQRDVILSELLSKFYEIAKAPYGHFTILKMITYGNKNDFMKKITQGLKCHFVSLGCHVIGARTVETVLQLYPSMFTKHLKAEFYGKNFNILVPEVPTSLHHLVELLPNKRFHILDHMKDLIHKFVLKGLFDFNYVHTLVWEYCYELIQLEQQLSTSATTPTITDRETAQKKLLQYQNELINSLIDVFPKLMSTKLGNKITCYIITITTAKDRKKIIKQLKGKVLSYLLHRYSYITLMKLLAVTDDTINIQKTLLEEIKSLKVSLQYTATGEIIPTSTLLPLFQILTSENGHKLFLYLFNYPKSYLNHDYDNYLLNSLISKTSKKDDLLRRKEYIVYFQQTLFYVVNRHIKELIVSKYASKVIEAMVYTYYNAADGLLENIARVYTNQEPVIDEPEDLLAENEEEQEEGEGDEEIAGEEEDGEEEEGDNEEDDEDNEGDDDDEVEIENEEEFNEQLEEAEADKLERLKNKSHEDDEVEEEEAEKVEEIESDDVPIEEDPTAHVLLKRLLRFEAKLQAKNASTSDKDQAQVQALTTFHEQLNQEYQFHQKDEAELTSIINNLNTSLWKSSDDENNEDVTQSFAILGNALLQSLTNDNEVASHWLSTNRCSYALFELFSIPSVYLQLEKTFPAWEKEIENFESTLNEHDGGKLLWKLYQSAKEQSNAKKGNKKNEKASTTASAKKTPKKK